MNRSYIASAIFLSLSLILGAVWFRFSLANNTMASVQIVDKADLSKSDSTPTYDELFGNQGEIVPLTDPLSQTDLIGRQLFSDYIGLISKGQATPANIDSLAEKYASQIIETTPVQNVSLDQIAVVPDTPDSMLSYAKKLTGINLKYKALTSLTYNKYGSPDTSDVKFTEFISETAALYERASLELIEINTPSTLSDYHLKIVKNYLSSAQALSSIGKVSEDPLSAYAALTNHAENTQEIESLFAKIQGVLATSGIDLEIRGI